MSLNQAFVRNMGTCRFGVAAKQARKYVSSKPIREKPQVQKHEGESTDTKHRDRATRSSDEVCESRWSEGVAVSGSFKSNTSNEEETI